MRLLERLLNVRGSVAGKVVATALTVLLVTPLAGIKASTDSQEATDAQVASDIAQVIDDVDSDAAVDSAPVVVDPIETDEPATDPQPEDEAPAVTEDEDPVETEEAPAAPAEEAVPVEVQEFLDAVKALEAFGPVNDDNADAFTALGQKAMDAYEAVQNAGLEDYEGVPEALATLTALMDSITGGTETTDVNYNEDFGSFPVTFSLDNPLYSDPFDGKVWEKIEEANVVVGQTITADGINDIDPKTKYYISSIDPKTKTITAKVVSGAKGAIRLPAPSQLWKDVVGVSDLEAFSHAYYVSAEMYADPQARWCVLSRHPEFTLDAAKEDLSNSRGISVTYVLDADDIVTDKWQYRAQLDFDGAAPDADVPAAMTMHSDKDRRMTFDLSSAQPTRPGYTFLGWSYSPNDPQSIIPTSSVMITCNANELTTLTLHAIWSLNPLPVVNWEYTIEIAPEGLGNDDPYGMPWGQQVQLPGELTIGYAASYACSDESVQGQGIEGDVTLTLDRNSNQYKGTISVPMWDFDKAKEEIGEGAYLDLFKNEPIEIELPASLAEAYKPGEYTMTLDPENFSIAISLEYVEKIKYQVKWYGNDGTVIKELEFWEDAPELSNLESMAPNDMITVPEGKELIWMRTDPGMYPGMENPGTEITFHPWFNDIYPGPVDPDDPNPPVITTVTIQWMDGFGSLLHVLEGVEVADSYTYPNADPTWPNYTFLGWSDPEDLGNGIIRIVAQWQRQPDVIITVPTTPEVTEPPAQAPEEEAPAPLTIADVPAILSAAAETVAEFMDTPVFGEPEPMAIEDAENPLAAPGEEAGVGEAIQAFTWGDYYIIVGVAAVAIIAAGALLRRYKISQLAAAAKNDGNEQ